MWTVKRHDNEEYRTWYSEEEYNELKEKLAKYEKLVYNISRACHDATIDFKSYVKGALRALEEVK